MSDVPVGEAFQRETVYSRGHLPGGHLDWSAALARMTCNPARILHLAKGTLQIGADADVTIIDPDVRWTVDPAEFRSKSTNTPFAGWELTGRAEVVIVGGRVKFRRKSKNG